MLKYKFLPDGAFVCGDTATGVTVYSYPTSIHANAAKRNAETAARSILREQGRYRGDPAIVAAYDAEQRRTRLPLPRAKCTQWNFRQTLRSALPSRTGCPVTISSAFRTRTGFARGKTTATKTDSRTTRGNRPFFRIHHGSRLMADKWSVRRIYLDSGGYTRSSTYTSPGHYYGHGAPLYQAMRDDGESFMLRAGTREQAKAHVRALHPDAKFYGGGK